MNATVFVSGKYGKSMTENDEEAFSINSKGDLFTYHTLPELTAVTPNIGGINGKTHIQIKGNSFDAYPGKTKVQIGKTDCEIVSINSTDLTCLSPKQTDMEVATGGSRGLMYEAWVITTTTDYSTLATDAADYRKMVVDNSTINGRKFFDQVKGFTARMRGLFVAPYTGKVAFYLHCTFNCTLNWSNSTDSSVVEQLLHWPEGNNKDSEENAKSRSIEVVKGDEYYIEALHTHSDKDVENFLQISLWEHQTFYARSTSHIVTDERQRFRMRYGRRLETQKITMNGVTGVDDIIFTQAGKESSKAFPVATASAKSSWEGNFQSMLEHKCEKIMTGPLYIQDYENENYSLNGAYGWFNDQIVPHCGKRSLNAVTRLMHRYGKSLIDATKYKWVCFAVRGERLLGDLNLLVNWQRESDSRNMRTWNTLKNLWKPTNDWQYNCFNWEDLLKNTTYSGLTGLKSDNPTISIEDIITPVADGVGEWYHDDFSITQEQVELTRKVGAVPSEEVFVQKVDVNWSEGEDSAEIVIDPRTCNEEKDDFQLFGVKDADIVGLDLSQLLDDAAKQKVIQDHLKTNDNVTFTSSAWGGGTINIVRTERGSRALSGNYSISWRGKTIENMPFDISSEELAHLLESKFGMIGVNVWYWGRLCYYKQLAIDFGKTSLTGDVEDIQFHSSNINTDDLHWSQFFIDGYGDGGAFIEEVGGDFYRLQASDARISVYVNDFLASCTSSCINQGEDCMEKCKFSYDADTTPKMTSVSDTTVNGKTGLTILGEKFSTNINEYNITVAGEPCQALEATVSSVKCSLSPGPAGTFDIVMVVKNQGEASQPSSGQLTYTVALGITSNSPENGSIGGGTLVTVRGTGFPNSVQAWDDNTITVAGIACKVKESSYNEFKCLTKEGADGTTGLVEITVNQETVSGGIFTYDGSVSPRVNSYSPTSALPLGGGILNITGTSFGAKWGKVFIGDVKCNLETWLTSSITCKIPRNQHGMHNVYVEVPDQGFASTEGLSPFQVNFKVTNMIPKVGSPLGGTTVILSGQGFGNCSNVMVSMGELLSCKINSCTDTKIECVTERIAKTITINNGGKHPRYGLGYVWNPSEVSVMPGDMIQWRWSITTSTTSGINILQTDSPTVDKHNGRGFTSGEKKESGIFQETFITKGTYYYTSDPVRDLAPIMRGTVVVTENNEDQTPELLVMMEDIAAYHEIESSSPETIDTIDACSITNINSCASDPILTDKFLFLAATCLQAYVDEVIISENSYSSDMPNYIFDNAKLTLNGQGFSTTACQNDVRIGEHSCLVDAATSTSIICTLQGNPQGGVPLQSLRKEFLSVNILNSGKAIIADDNTDMGSLVLYPEIKSVNIAEGSWTGGNVLILSGKGLLPYGGIETVQIIFGEEFFQASCSVISVTYDAISCLVPDYRPFKGNNQEKEVPIIVTLGYQQLMPYQVSNATFTFKNSLLSTATAISTSTITAKSEVSITGTNFGTNVENVKIFAKLPNSLSRRRRSIPEKVVVQENILEPECRWKKMGAKYWRCPEKGICSNEEVISNVEPKVHSRTKRNTYDIKSDEDDKRLTMEICREFPNQCHDRIQRMSKHQNSRTKRSTDYEDLLELSPLTENSYEADIISVTDTSITFKFVNLPAGTYEVLVNMEGGVGNADVSFGQISSEMTINSVAPTAGSIHGGHLIAITGGGFSGDIINTEVKIGETTCQITEMSPSVISCITASCSEGCGDLVVTSNSIEATSSYDYLTSSSPAVSAVSGLSGTKINIQGSKFGSNPSVRVGEYTCSVDSASNIQIQCTLPLIVGGAYPVVVNNPDIGNSNMDITWTVDLEIYSVTPATGSFGGGTLLIIAGTGFSDADAMNVTVCEALCNVQNATTTQIDCITPGNSNEAATLDCDVVVTQASGAVTKSAGFKYDKSLTPTITTVDPLRGGTGGGTLITIKGSGFSTSGNEITIDGSICDINTQSETEITCYTNYHNGAIKSPLILDVPDKGYAAYEDESLATFYYIDRWSSKWTWSGLGSPVEGEFVVITPGMTILLDIDTPVIKFLLINGGTLIFDEENPSVELQAEYILIAGGGSLQIGTEEKPYTSLATITMHGNVRCTEMPVFGCKVWMNKDRQIIRMLNP